MVAVPFFATLALVVMIVLVVLIVSRQYAAGGASRVEAWASREYWQPATCSILSTGVACADKDSHTTCGGYGMGGAVKHISGVASFDYRDIAACPGSYWCAKEGADCACVGEVTYATELFDGDEYQAVQSSRLWRLSTGTVKCGTDERGEPYADPAPGRIKHCWCTPQEVLDMLRDRHSSVDALAACSDSAGRAFAGRPGAGAMAPGDGRGSVTLAELGASEQMASEGELGEDEDATEDGLDDVGARERRLTTNSRRRRRTYVYTPWALVEVCPPPGDARKPTIACAYRFGAPGADGQTFTSDGAVGQSFTSNGAVTVGWWPNGGQSAQAAAETWIVGQGAPAAAQCFVRSGVPDTCAVGMEPVEGLVQEAQKTVTLLTCGCVLAALVLVALAAYKAAQLMLGTDYMPLAA